MRPIAAVFTLLGGLVPFASAQEVLPGTRDAWLWPFTPTSIWNHPIGADAVYEPANLRRASNVGVDTQHIMELSASDPLRPALGTTAFGPGRCNGTEQIGVSLNIPDEWLVPDAGNSPYGGTPNSNFAFRLPDSDTVFEGSLVSRCVAGGPVYLPDWMRWPNNRWHQDLRGDGFDGGGQGASRMSALGGTLRMGELVGTDPIRHVIKVNPWCERDCYYSNDLPGFKWPARSADNYAPGGYRGTDPNLVMGTLLAIPPGITEASLGLQTEAGRKLFFAMQNYGVYFTEDAAWDVWDLIVERDAEIEFEQVYGFSMKSTRWRDEINRLMQALHVVTNNSPTSIGGGGALRQPLAPAFADRSATDVETPETPRVKDLDVTAYPNPLAGNTLYLSQPADVEVYTVTGVRVTQGEHVSSVDLGDAAPGLYLLRVTTPQGIKHLPVIKR
ncbi:MAG: T9SS type A sorting domain-containing protein [Bacteroidota bacterium]